MDCSCVLVWQRKTSTESKPSSIWQGHIPGERQSGRMPGGRVISHGDGTYRPEIDTCLVFQKKPPSERMETKRISFVYLGPQIARVCELDVLVHMCAYIVSL